MNALKHGLSGVGIALPAEDVEAIDVRFREYRDEMNPHSAAALNAVGRIAFLTVRLDRCAVYEARMTAYRQRQAIADFDDARLAEAEKLFSTIAIEPKTHARRLKRMPEGVDMLLEALRGLRMDLLGPHGAVWNYQRADMLHHCMGVRIHDLPTSRHLALTEAIMNRDFKLLKQDPGELPPEGLNRQELELWCLNQLVDLIEVEIAKLKDLRASMDLAGLELDRAEAVDRALIDCSKQGENLRKYEAAAERGLYRARREFLELQAEVPAPMPDPLEPEPPQDPGPPLPGVPEGAEELGSSPPEDGGEVVAETNLDPIDPRPAKGAEIAAEGPSGVAPRGEEIGERR